VISRTLAVGVLAATGIFGLGFGCRPKPELHGRPCKEYLGQCGKGEVCVIVYDEDGDCTGDGYCAGICTSEYEICFQHPPGDERQKCLATEPPRPKCPPDLVCKTVLDHCIPRDFYNVCVPENVDPGIPPKRSSCAFSPR
jgi:hypothetical protein